MFKIKQEINCNQRWWELGKLIFERQMVIIQEETIRYLRKRRNPVLCGPG
jgi:hypothetical protein